MVVLFDYQVWLEYLRMAMLRHHYLAKEIAESFLPGDGLFLKALNMENLPRSPCVFWIGYCCCR
jgi:hypothetical protein